MWTYDRLDAVRQVAMKVASFSKAKHYVDWAIFQWLSHPGVGVLTTHLPMAKDFCVVKETLEQRPHLLQA